MSPEEVAALTDQVEHKVEAFDAAAANDDCQEVLADLQEVLGPDHYLLVRLKEKYLKSPHPDSSLEGLSEEELRMRLDFAHHILRVKGRLETGEPNWMKIVIAKRNAYSLELNDEF